jgi:hypothetical protein
LAAAAAAASRHVSYRTVPHRRRVPSSSSSSHLVVVVDTTFILCAWGSRRWAPVGRCAPADVLVTGPVTIVHRGSVCSFPFFGVLSVRHQGSRATENDDDSSVGFVRLPSCGPRFDQVASREADLLMPLVVLSSWRLRLASWDRPLGPGVGVGRCSFFLWEGWCFVAVQVREARPARN